jgi:hypothetical protein
MDSMLGGGHRTSCVQRPASSVESGPRSPVTRLPVMNSQQGWLVMGWHWICRPRRKAFPASRFGRRRLDPSSMAAIEDFAEFGVGRYEGLTLLLAATHPLPERIVGEGIVMQRSSTPSRDSSPPSGQRPSLRHSHPT